MMSTDAWYVATNERFECCVCGDQTAWQSEDYLIIRLKAPINGNDTQLLGVHARCFNKFTHNIVGIILVTILSLHLDLI